MFVFLGEMNCSFYTTIMGIVLYTNVLSAVTKNALGGRGGSFSIRLRKCFGFSMCDRRLLAKGWINWVISLKELIYKLFIKIIFIKANINGRKTATFEQQVSDGNALNNINRVLINLLGEIILLPGSR